MIKRLCPLLIVLTSCGRSPLPAPEFPTVPPAFAESARYGVVTLREASIVMKGAGSDGTVPSLRSSNLTRILVTGQLEPHMHRRTIVPTDGCVVTTARARLATKGKKSVEVDGLAGAPPLPSDVAQVTAWPGAKPVVELELPAPAVGALLDFFVEQTCIRGFDMVPPVVFGAAMPTLDSKMSIRADPSFQARVVVSKGGDQVTTLQAPPQKGGQAWTLRERDLPAYHDDAFSIDSQHTGPWAQVVIGSVRAAGGEKSYADGWSSIAAHVREAAEPASPAGSPEGDLKGSATARLRKLRDRLAPKVARAPFAPARRYADIPAGGATPFEVAAAIVLATKDSPDRGHLALATLADGPLLVDSVPSLYPFRAVLVATRANGGWQFDDPTCLNCPPGHLPSDLAGGRALVVTDEGYEITEVPFGATETSRARMQIAWNLTGIELAGTVLADFEGSGARKLAKLMEAATVQASPESLGQVRSALFGSAAGLELLGVGESSPPNARPYEMRFQVAAKADASGSLLRLPVYRVAGPWVPWLTPVSEPRDVVLPGPLRAETTVTIQMPKSYNMARLGDISVRKTVGEYQIHVEHRDDVVTITRRIGLFTRHVPKERFGELRELVLAAADADAQVIELNVGR